MANDKERKFPTKIELKVIFEINNPLQSTSELESAEILRKFVEAAFDILTYTSGWNIDPTGTKITEVEATFLETIEISDIELAKKLQTAKARDFAYRKGANC